MITSLKPNQVFVFGSNLAGRHGKGAALCAMKFGAQYGKGIGIQGQSYAIPTKDSRLQALPLDVIAIHVDSFLAFASLQAGLEFLVTEVGCGLAGYDPSQIGPLFRGAPSNVILPKSFQP